MKDSVIVLAVTEGERALIVLKGDRPDPDQRLDPRGREEAEPGDDLRNQP